MNSAPKNIEIFERVVAVALARLYDAFPNPIDLDAGSVGNAALGDGDSAEEVFQIIAETAGSTITFLVNEGFVRYDPSGGTIHDSGIFRRASLTLKGFTLLGKTPKAIDGTVDRRTYGQILKATMKDGTKSVAQEAVKSLLVAAASMGTTAISQM